MQEKKRQGKTPPLPELQSSVTEILVANGRSFQPFIRTFSYTGDNVVKSNLGTLVGVFEIDEMSEDSAYIVNFLASVAKKEYWSNPRRGAIESFEAALHKINLALAELVKHGNVAWLGKFHGAIGVLEKNNLHFSVTGKAKIILFRNDSLSDISVGLSSEESHIHPIKTFVEVSSGRLAKDDRVIITSPELLALFSLDDLAKNGRRMDHDRFTQFLKTALVNELDMSGALIVDVREELVAPTPKTVKKPGESTPEQVHNVFSQSAFLAQKAKEAASEEALASREEQAEKQEKEEYIDTKTGHIYVQGAAAEPTGKHQQMERFMLGLQEFGDAFGSFLSVQGRWIRKGKKQSLLALAALKEEAVVLGRKTGRTLRRQWRKQKEAYRKRQLEKQAAAASKPETPRAPEREEETKIAPSFVHVSDITLPETKIETVDSPKQEDSELETLLTPEEILEEEVVEVLEFEEKEETEQEEIPQFMREKLALFYRREQTIQAPKETSPTSKTAEQTGHILSFISASWNAFTDRVATFFHKLSQLPLREKLSRSLVPVFIAYRRHSVFLRRLPLRKKQLTIVTLGVVLLSAAVFFLTSGSPEENAPMENNEQTAASVSDTDTVDRTEMTSVLSGLGEAIVAPVMLNDEAYVITERSVVAVSDNRSFPLPAGGKATLAAAMDDLRLIFVYTESGRLYAFSPISKSFVENTLSLGENVRVTDLGTYLTYLYVLDSATDQIYRFPRADGGFGASTAWLKDTLSIEDTAHMAVNETLFVSPHPGTIHGLFRGRSTSTLELPADGLSITNLYTYPDLANVYALDREHRKLFVWNQEGKLLKEYSDEKFSEAQSLSVNEKTNEAFIGTEDSLLSFKLK